MAVNKEQLLVSDLAPHAGDWEVKLLQELQILVNGAATRFGRGVHSVNESCAKALLAQGRTMRSRKLGPMAVLVSEPEPEEDN